MSIKSVTDKLLLPSTAGSNTFRTILEKHLHDYKKGKGYLSKQTSFQIDDQAKSTSSLLSKANLKANEYYSKFQSGLTYNQRARFVNGVYESAKRISQITTPQIDPIDIVEPQKAIIDEIA